MRVADGLEEFVRAWAALPGQATAVADVEVLADDLAPGGLDQGSGTGELPVPGGLGVLKVSVEQRTAKAERITCGQAPGGVWRSTDPAMPKASFA